VLKHSTAEERSAISGSHSNDIQKEKTMDFGCTRHRFSSHLRSLDIPKREFKPRTLWMLLMLLAIEVTKEWLTFKIGAIDIPGRNSKIIPSEKWPKDFQNKCENILLAPDCISWCKMSKNREASHDKHKEWQDLANTKNNKNTRK
jgi:hypothetical protein